MAERAGPGARLKARPERALPVTGADGSDLRIDLSGTGLGGAWVGLTWRDPGSGGIARALLSALSENGESVALAEEPLGGCRRTSWPCA